MKTYINILQKLLGEEESIYPEQGNQFEFAKEFWKRTTATTSNNNPKHGIIIPTTYEELNKKLEGNRHLFFEECDFMVFYPKFLEVYLFFKFDF